MCEKLGDFYLATQIATYFELSIYIYFAILVNICLKFIVLISPEPG